MDSCREKGVGSVDEIHTPDIHTPGDDDDQIRMRIRAEPKTDEKELVRDGEERKRKGGGLAKTSQKEGFFYLFPICDDFTLSNYNCSFQSF